MSIFDNQHHQSTTPIYPEIHLPMIDENGNAFAILNRAMRLMREHEIDKSEIDQFQAEATADGCDHLLQTCMRWFNCAVESVDKHILEIIALECLDIPTLETRNGDSEDFYDCAVWNIRKALEQAYEAGQKSG